MKHVVHLRDTGAAAGIAALKPRIKPRVFVFVLVVFVMAAAMQSLMLGNMLSEAESIGQDIQGIRAEQKVLHEKYASYNNNLSYYFNDCSR